MTRVVGRRAWVGFLGCLGASVGASCSAPAKGSLVLAIDTDMQAPKDVDIVSVFITTDSVAKFDYLGRVLPDGTVALPATLAIIEPDTIGAPVRIRVTAFKDQTARVVRDVLTTVPHQQTSLLRLPLNFLDDGSAMGTLPADLVPDGPAGAPEGDTTFDPDTIGSKCDLGMSLTSINGVCASAGVDSSKLQAYDPTLVYGSGALQANGAPTTCFDVSACFASATPAQGLDTSHCTVALPEGSTGGGNLNFALETATDGACNAQGQCFVPIENDPNANDPNPGWLLSGSTVTLLPGICAKIAEGATLYMVRGTCPSKDVANPVCQPTGGSSDGGIAAPLDASADATTARDGGAETDASVGFPDTGSVCPAGFTACSADVCSNTQSDPVNCGVCGKPCPSGVCQKGTCVGGSMTADAGSGPGSATTIASGLTSPYAIAVDSTTAYVTSGPDIVSFPLGGGPMTTLFAAGITPAAIAVDANNVYWVDVGSAGAQNGAVMQRALYSDAGAVTTLASGQNMNAGMTAGGTAGYITLDAHNVYWTNLGTGSNGEVLSVPIDGGTITTIAAGQGNPQGLAVDTTDIYWGNNSTGGNDVLQMVFDGGSPVSIASEGNFNPFNLAIDSSNVYWTNQSYGTVERYPLIGGSVVTMATGGGLNWGIAVDATNVYWTDSSSGTVKATPLASTVSVTPATLASGQGTPKGIALDATSVYWTNASAGTVMMTSKPAAQ